MLTKDLLRVSRAGGGYHPQFADADDERLAARVLGTYQGRVGERRERLQAALTDIERECGDFKLVRGLAKLVERESAFETRSPVPPERARRAAFAAAEDVGVVTEAERREALSRAAARLGGDTHPEAVSTALYADRESRQVLASVDAPWGPSELIDRYNLSLAQTKKRDHLPSEVQEVGRELVRQYNLSLAQTALFDATEVRVRSSDPKALISAVKRLRLMYEIRKVDGQREIVVTGPDSLFRTSRRYGTRFARLLRTIAKSDSWELEAIIDDYGTERTMRLSDSDPIEVPNAEPVAEVEFDSGIEADFAARFEALDLDWDLVREPEALEAGNRVMIPDFAFDYRYADFRVFFEIMGFWTPEYVAKKLDQLETVEDVEMVVAVDESLGVGEEIEARDHQMIPYSGSVPLKDVRDALRRYEEQLEAETTAELSAEIRPSSDVIGLEELARKLGVSESAIEDVAFPDHERVGRTLVRPGVLDRVESDLESGMTVSEATAEIESHGITESSSVLSRLGYSVEWEGLSGGTIHSSE